MDEAAGLKTSPFHRSWVRIDLRPSGWIVGVSFSLAFRWDSSGDGFHDVVINKYFLPPLYMVTFKEGQLRCTVLFTVAKKKHKQTIAFNGLLFQ